MFQSMQIQRLQSPSASSTEPSPACVAACMARHRPVSSSRSGKYFKCSKAYTFLPGVYAESMPQQHLTPQLHALHQRLLCFFPHKLQHMSTLDHMAYTLCQGYLRCLSRFNLVSFMISQRLPVLSKARALLKPLSFNAGPGHRFSQQTWRSVMGCQPQHQQQRCSL